LINRPTGKTQRMFEEDQLRRTLEPFKRKKKQNRRLEKIA
jgi:hypothetical protein